MTPAKKVSSTGSKVSRRDFGATHKPDCSAQLQVIDDLKMKVVELQRELDRARELTALATGDARQAQQARASLSRYAPRDEIKKADAAVQRADAKATEGVHAEAPIAQEI